MSVFLPDRGRRPCPISLCPKTAIRGSHSSYFLCRGFRCDTWNIRCTRILPVEVDTIKLLLGGISDPLESALVRDEKRHRGGLRRCREGVNDDVDAEKVGSRNAPVRGFFERGGAYLSLFCLEGPVFCTATSDLFFPRPFVGVSWGSRADEVGIAKIFSLVLLCWTSSGPFSRVVRLPSNSWCRWELQSVSTLASIDFSGFLHSIRALL